MFKRIVKFLPYLLALLVVRQGNCSLEYIKRNDLLGVYLDTVSNPRMDSLVLVKAIRMKRAETGEQFNCPPTVSQRFGFSEMPGVFLYSLNACSRLSAGTIRDPYELLLYNSANSEVYRFMGKIASFNEIARSALVSNMNQYFIEDLLRLYLNTLGPTSIYYILNSYSDFKDFYDRELQLSSSPLKEYPPFKEKTEDDLAKARQHITVLTWSREDNTYRYDFFCINWGRRRLEHWKFEISSHGLKIKKMEVVLEQLGYGYTL